ncbi:amino acid ABC transporter substrate-binding protein [Kineosporia sp. J2-2]|uniref:Amino acid ABC transporter substrate-binding protein n=1 Tax=Kineosporia corallincola TaxID=2835133 RepID=A0ABS5T9Q5_9ACTN|nr:ABC transporter substrate-binding protein [Kineosporia corallincola]MBT0767791.1 amino acid ABC transporter substrate-binding protein [Kineosporia corallincola]
MSRRLPAAGSALLALLAVAACAPADSNDEASSAGSSSSSSAASCAPADLDTLTSGTLTIGTDSPAYSPWFEDNDPANGKGYESAVAYAVAKQLGYTDDQVKWSTVTFNAAVQPGKKAFDFDINQFSITDERKEAVDFSSGYYDVAQAVVTVKGSKAAGATSIADLKGLKLGAQVGTTSYDVIESQIAPTSDPSVFDDNDKAKLALNNGQIDALVVDLPTALYLASAELDDGVVVGQLPQTGDAQEQFGLLLAKNSSLTDCVTQAVDALREDGTLETLETEYLTDSAGAPELK